MTDHLAAPETPSTAPAKKPAPNRRSDGHAGPPVLAAPPPPPVAMPTPGAQNAALKEPAPAPGEGYVPNHPAAAHLVVLDAKAGVVGLPNGVRLPRRKIAICGFASSTRKYMPMPDPEWEIWGLNQLYRHVPRADRWFDIHYNWDQEVVPGTDHRSWCRDCGIPVYLMDAQPDLPTSVRFPIEAVIKHFDADYFTSTIAYMTALAVMEIDLAVDAELSAQVAKMTKAQLAATTMRTLTEALYKTYTIGLFGIDLTVGEEYFHEKPCAEFWIGQASARGIGVAIPKESALTKQRYRYGYERNADSLIKLVDIANHQALITAEREELRKRLCMLEGVYECNERWKQFAELRERGTEVN